MSSASVLRAHGRNLYGEQHIQVEKNNLEARGQKMTSTPHDESCPSYKYKRSDACDTSWTTLKKLAIAYSWSAISIVRYIYLRTTPSITY
jgi:hypothetical protein